MRHIILHFVEQYGMQGYEGQQQLPIHTEVKLSPPNMISVMSSWTCKTMETITRECDEGNKNFNRSFQELLTDPYIFANSDDE